MARGKKRSGAFDELEENIKEAIYSVEQDFIEAEELELYKIMLEKKEILFNWAGYERALKMLQDDDSDDEIDAEEKTEIYHDHLTIYLEDYDRGTEWCFNIEYGIL